MDQLWKQSLTLWAVAIGNAHGNYPAASKLAFDVLKKIYEKVKHHIEVFNCERKSCCSGR